MVVVARMISTTGRICSPVLSLIRRSETVATRMSASRWRMISWASGGKWPIRRLIGRNRPLGVQGREDQVPGLGRLDAGVDGLQVAHLADHDDVGIHAQGRTQGRGEVLGVDPHLALDDAALVGREDELDRVLDGDDVEVEVLVQVAQHRGQGGRLAVAGGAGNEDQPVGRLGDFRQHRRQVQFLERAHMRRDDPHDDADCPALAEDAAPEAPAVRQGIGGVQFAERSGRTRLFCSMIVRAMNSVSAGSGCRAWSGPAGRAPGKRAGCRLRSGRRKPSSRRRSRRIWFKLFMSMASSLLCW